MHTDTEKKDTAEVDGFDSRSPTLPDNPFRRRRPGVDTNVVWLASDIPYAGLLLGALILVVGNTFNVVISLLGAFVHPTRLQYVEFFGKFYEAGGRNFKPFAPRKDRLVLRPREAGGEEGG